MSEKIQLLPATTDFFNDFFAIKCEPMQIRWGGFTSAPDKSSFRVWFDKQLISEKRKIYFGISSGSLLGYVYLDFINSDTVELTDAVSTAYQGMGIATEMIFQSCEIAKGCGYKFIRAWVSIANKASQKVFEKNGFNLTGHSEQRSLPMIDNASTFFLWEKKLDE